MLEKEFLAVVEETRLLLENNPEWRNRYDKYADKISENRDFIKIVRSSFHEWHPLKTYITIGEVIKNKNKGVIFNLRYNGQAVAELKVDKQNSPIISTADYIETNNSDFDCTICLSDAAWNGSEAAKFRSHFKNRKAPRNRGKGNEHRLESLWLTELSKRKDKALPYVKPVMIGGVRFSMCTPLSASDHSKIKYSGPKGGGIDILTRTGTGGPATYLCILELKDTNESEEPPKDAMKQAVAYATFIRELLRSNTGAKWWKIFGFNRKLPDKLVLYSACMMPSNDLNDYSFKDMELSIEDDIIKLHYVYFKEAGNKIISVDTSL